MLLFYFLLFLFIHSSQAGERIIGGEEVPITKYPHQTALYRRRYKSNFFQCGAVIINPKHLLTAAHCKRGQTKEYLIVTGHSAVPGIDDGLSLDKNGYKIKEFTLHPEFDQSDPPIFNHDIAIITVVGCLKLDGVFAKAIDLSRISTPAGIMAEVSGYGNTERIVAKRPRNQAKMRILKVAYVPIVDRSSCIKYLGEHHPNYHVTENMICAGHPCENDACQGDSGGPLINEDKLIGLVSFGKGCGSFDPGVYTDIYKHLDFIANMTGLS